MIAIKRIALFEGALNGLFQVFQRVLIPLAEAHVLILKAALEEEIGQRSEQVFRADSEAEARNASGSLGPKPNTPVFSISPLMLPSCCAIALESRDSSSFNEPPNSNHCTICETFTVSK